MTFEVTNLKFNGDVSEKPQNTRHEISSKAELSALVLNYFFSGDEKAYNDATEHFKQWGNKVIANETNIWRDFAKENGLEEPDGPLRWR